MDLSTEALSFSLPGMKEVSGLVSTKGDLSFGHWGPRQNMQGEK